MGSSLTECDICYDVFSDDSCPRLLPCSHSLCTPCINNIIQRHGILSCPSCRSEFPATSADKFTINRALLDVAKQLSSTHVSSKTPSSGTKRSLEDLTNDFRKRITKTSIRECQEMITETLDEIETLSAKKYVVSEENEKIDRFIEALKRLKLSNERILKDLSQNTQLLMDNVDSMQSEELKHRDFDHKVAEATDYTSAGPVMDEAEKAVGSLQEKMKLVKDLLVKTKTERDVIEKKIQESKKSLEDIVVNRNKTVNQLHGRIEEGFVTKNITVHDLRSLCSSFSRDIVTRPIFAVKEIEGVQNVARVIINSQNQEVSLSHLEASDVPPGSLVLKHESLMQRSSRKAFLEYVFDEELIGRITIEVIDEGNLAKNFLHLCSGDLGPSWANSKFLNVWSRRNPGESVFFSGTYNTAVLSGVDWKKESQRKIYKETSFKAGDVRGFFSCSDASAFYVVTREKPSCKNKNTFGFVVDGMDFLKDVISKRPVEVIRKIKILDCGLIVSL